jgi:hypothetical protein
MISIEAVIPRRLGVDPKDVLREIEKTMRKKTSRDLKRDFRKTVRTWNEKPRFRDVFFKQPNQYILKVFPDGSNADKYAWVDLGTRPHLILPKSPNTRLKFPGDFTPKTTPGRIGSSRGGKSGQVIYPRVVRHPGIEPRNFSKNIAKHNEKAFQRDIQDAVSRAVN